MDEGLLCCAPAGLTAEYAPCGKLWGSPCARDPPCAAFAAGAKAAGCTFADGGGMLVAQAVATVQAVCDVSGIDCELSFDELFEIMANAAGFNV